MGKGTLNRLIDTPCVTPVIGVKTWGKGVQEENAAATGAGGRVTAAYHEAGRRRRGPKFSTSPQIGNAGSRDTNC